MITENHFFFFLTSVKMCSRGASRVITIPVLVHCPSNNFSIPFVIFKLKYYV